MISKAQAIKNTSSKAFKKSIFIFRRDHRLDDNTGLLYALKHSDTVVPVFIFDHKQIDPEKNQFYGSNCVQFMCESLEDLDNQLKKKGSRLTLIHGSYPEIIDELIDAVHPNLVCVNQDYTVYSKTRDDMISEACKKNGVEFKSFEDICLLGKDTTLKEYEGSDVFFKKFTPYYNRVVKHKVRLPQECTDSNFFKGEVKVGEVNVNDFGKKYFKFNSQLVLKGGREQGIQALGEIHRMKDYEELRNQPMKNTSMLSAYNKFGCISIREVYHTAKTVLKEKADPFLRQLYWRDFYYYIGLFYPHVYAGPMKPSYSMIPWEDDATKIEAWKQGKTGCPIVDAAMRQLNATGWMPNRCRMIVSNYLIKDLHVNWQIGERYFASQLVDFDPAQNNGGWQWSAGSGVDSQPYFRIFNPKLQMEKFDPKCQYIKHWCPELKSVAVEDIHNWETAHKQYKVDYPSPIVIHDKAKVKLIKMYKESFDLTADYQPDGSEDEASGKGKERKASLPAKGYGQQNKDLQKPAAKKRGESMDEEPIDKPMKSKNAANLKQAHKTADDRSATPQKKISVYLDLGKRVKKN